MSGLFGGDTLDTARRPDDLIPGCLDALDATIAGLTKLGVSGQDAAAGMGRLCTREGWTGAAADAFRAAWRMEPDRWSGLGDALANAAQALEPYRDELRHGQGEAMIAMVEWRQAQRVTAAATLVHQRLQGAYDAARLLGQSVNAPPGFDDPGAAGRAAAIARLSAARTRVGQAAMAAVRILAESRDALPAEPGAWQRFADGFVDTFSTLGTQAEDFAGGAVDATIGLAGTVQRLNPGSPYNETHPAQYEHRLDEAGQAAANVVAHPGAAVRSMVNGAVQTWTHDPGRALGSLVPGMLLGAATGGVGEAAAAGSLAEGAADELTTMAGVAGDDAAQAVDAAALSDAVPASSVNATTPWGSWTLSTQAGEADAAVAAGVQDSGAGLAQAERDLSTLHVHPDVGPSVQQPVIGDSSVHPVGVPAHSVSRTPEWGTFGGWDLPARTLTTNPVAAADNAAAQAVRAAGGGLSQAERDLSEIRIQPSPSARSAVGGTPMPDRSVGGFDLTPPPRSAPAPTPLHAGRLPTDYTDRGYLVDGAVQRAYLDRYPPSPADLQWLDDIRLRWPQAKNLTDADLLALHQYKTSAYALNRALRSGNAARIEALDDEIRVTASALNKLPDYRGVVMRARGVNLHPRQLERILRAYEPGRLVQEPGFTSTAKQPPGYGVIEYRIQSQHGKDISPMMGQDTGVQEVLFPPGSRFRVEARSYDPKTEKWEIYLTNVEG